MVQRQLSEERVVFFVIYSWLRWVTVVCRLSRVTASGDPPVAVRGLLIVVASPVAEHRL